VVGKRKLQNAGVAERCQRQVQRRDVDRRRHTTSAADGAVVPQGMPGWTARAWVGAAHERCATSRAGIADDRAESRVCIGQLPSWRPNRAAVRR
jgi:hypothetical protein